VVRPIGQAVKSATLLGAFLAVTLCLSANSLACSAPLPRSAKQIFRDSAYVFHGTAIRAEAVFLENEQGRVDDVPLIKVYWKVDRIFKGKNIGKRASVTNLICGAVNVVVGTPYVVSLQAWQGEAGQISGFGDVLGILDDQGTFGEFQEPEKFATLVTEFEKLRN
jgi:hypothetical protein